MGLTKAQKKLVYKSALHQARLGNIDMLRLIAKQHEDLLAEFESFAEDFKHYASESWYQEIQEKALTQQKGNPIKEK